MSSECFIQLHALDDRDLLSLADVKLKGLVTVIFHEVVHVSALQNTLYDGIFDPLLVIHIAFVEVVKIKLFLRLRSNLERATFVLLDAAAAMCFNQLLQLLRLVDIGQEEH